jgi:two-component system, chemotaxis family, protein-glutamate methylesterase/glutaminase
MSKIRVLVVDDAVVVRRLVADLLAADDAIEVVGTAANGRIALAKIAQLKPDLVTLDLEIPERDGLETLAALRQAHPFLPIVVFSRLAQSGASISRDALALGANDCVAMPENAGAAPTADCIRDQLIPRIKRLGARRAGRSTLVMPSPVARPAGRSALFTNRSPVEVVAVGASTGGPNALAALFAAFPADFPVPVVVVQHMPAVFTGRLAARLSSLSAVETKEAENGAVVRPGRAWLAPGDFHLALARYAATVRLRTHQGPPENSCRPSVDVLFRSVAEVYGAGVLAVVLTGMGQDGLRGCERIRAAGGQVLAQDAASSVVWGMPGAVARAGLADAVLPLEQLGPEIVRRVLKGRSPSVCGLPGIKEITPNEIARGGNGA